MRIIAIILCFFLFLSCYSQSVKPNYEVVEDAIAGNNTGYYNNRPLYINNSNAFILTGDQPVLRLVKGENIYSNVLIGVQSKRIKKWLLSCSHISSFYDAGRMSWKITDKELPRLKIGMETLPMAKTTGMALSVNAEGVGDGDSLIVLIGGAQWKKGQNMSWKLDAMVHPELLDWIFNPEECRNNNISARGQSFTIVMEDSLGHKKIFSASGNCSEPATFTIKDALCWEDITKLEQSSGSSPLPVLLGKIALKEKKEIFLALEAVEIEDRDARIINSQLAFEEGSERIKSFSEILKIDTPDPYLNAIARASVAAIDGTWYPPVFVHGAMLWNIRFPGWRTLWGGTMYGWHQRIQEEAGFYIRSQVQESEKKEAKADPSKLLAVQHPDSRFYGKGRITQDQVMYNMQSQFFDQLIEEYRWTNDTGFINILRQALELHLEWETECFDPDGDGLYESYINSWPTDSQWYNGGGSAEETSYAYRGHLAARDMAHNAGDIPAERFHSRMLDNIKKGFDERLWIKKKGYPGAYREQGGHERLHENPWLYSIFLPVDAGLISPLQSLESLYYSEWALQNDTLPCGGRKVWNSNWVPGIWSVREQWPGDNYHLALCYFKSGLPEDGWSILKGTFMSTAFGQWIPGNLGGIQGGTDFGDCVHPFSRTLVEGLFGYNPDYPNQKVKISPQFPPEWDHASISLPDVKISFVKGNGNINYSFELSSPADLEMYLPIQCTAIRRVLVNGKNVSWKLLPGVGLSQLFIEQKNTSKANIEIQIETETAYCKPAFIEGNVGDVASLDVRDAHLLDIKDPQEALSDIRMEQNKVVARLAPNTGYHTVILLVEEGKAPQWRIFRIKINDQEEVARQKMRFVWQIPQNVNWEKINLSSFYNGNITEIFRQKYLEPRPNSVSLRLGTDGFSPWTFPFWKSGPPEIKLDRIGGLLKDKMLVTPQGTPFRWEGDTENVAFTSLWKNYPEQIEIPVNKTGDAVFFLVAGSTNVMQCQIANAVIKLNYADGTKDSLELIPPVNYWNLCPINANATAPGQSSRNYYTSPVDKFCMPAQLPETVELGENCRAMLLNLKMKPKVELQSITFQTLSQEVVVGLMGISVMKKNE